MRPKGRPPRLRAWLITAILTAIVVTVPGPALGAPAAALAPAAATAPPPTDVATAPPITANEFLPETRDVTDCIGVLEKPGCGNENRGGWRQYLVLGLLFLGLVVVFGNIARMVRRRG